MAVSNALDPTFELVNAKKRIISATTEGATRTLKPAESGAVILLDRAAGIVITLPAPTANAAIVYDFIVKTSVTSNAYTISTDAATTFLVGSVLNDDTDTADAVAWFCTTSAGTTVTLSANGSTKGGLVGSRYRLSSYDATHWLVEGVNKGSGDVTTPFA